MKSQEVLGRLSGSLSEICRRFRVQKLALFGSVARDEASENSDVDVLVDFEGRADFDRFMDLKFYLEDLLGAKVDLVTQDGLRPRMRPEIEREAIRVA